MNHEYFEALIVSSTFEKLPKETQELLSSIMSVLAETVSAGEAMAVEGAALEITSVEVPTEVPKSPRSPRPRPMPNKEGPKTKKDKHKPTPLVRASPRKHPQKEKPTT